MNKSIIIFLIILLFIFIWFVLLYTTLFELPNLGNNNPEIVHKTTKTFNLLINNNIEKTQNPKSIKIVTDQLQFNKTVQVRRKYKHRDIIINRPIIPNRYDFKETIYEPAPMEEIERNMTLYLQTLHTRLLKMAGPKVDALQVWEAYLDVTKNMPMKWDEENIHRFPKPRQDGSIFVSLGTYRDPFCPMTIKSLYSKARYPEKVFVGMFQQNCFGPKCRTGVLVGGKVEDAGPDIDCYVRSNK